MILSVRNLSIHIQAPNRMLPAVTDVSFDLIQGKTVALVGESGCGKSLTALSLMQLLPEVAQVVRGEILFEGKSLLEMPSKDVRKIRGKEMTMVFQEPMVSLNPVMKVGSQIAEVVEAHELVSKRESKDRSLEAMEEVHLQNPSSMFDRYPHELSGGQRQRIMLAMALVCRPKVLIADEPTTALDVTIQAQILDLVKELQEKHRMAILWITHDLSVVARIADEIAVMYAGSLVERGNAKEVLREPRHPYTRALYDSVPQLGIQHRRLKSIPGKVPPLDELPVWCRFFDRCELAEEFCKTQEPELKKCGDAREVRCLKVAHAH